MVLQDFKTSIWGYWRKEGPWVMRIVHYLRRIIYLYASCLAGFARLENLDLFVPEIGMEAFNRLVVYGGDEGKQRKARRWLELCLSDFFLKNKF